MKLDLARILIAPFVISIIIVLMIIGPFVWLLVWAFDVALNTSGKT
jgi:hypothetical protein